MKASLMIGTEWSIDWFGFSWPVQLALHCCLRLFWIASNGCSNLHADCTKLFEAREPHYSSILRTENTQFLKETSCEKSSDLISLFQLGDAVRFRSVDVAGHLKCFCFYARSCMRRSKQHFKHARHLTYNERKRGASPNRSMDFQQGQGVLNGTAALCLDYGVSVGQTKANTLYFASPCPNQPKLPASCLYSYFAS